MVLWLSVCLMGECKAGCYPETCPFFLVSQHSPWALPSVYQGLKPHRLSKFVNKVPWLPKDLSSWVCELHEISFLKPGAALHMSFHTRRWGVAPFTSTSTPAAPVLCSVCTTHTFFSLGNGSGCIVDLQQVIQQMFPQGYNSWNTKDPSIPDVIAGWITV